MITKAGGKLHAFYFAIGESDVFGISEFPDLATTVALGMAIGASGTVNFHTTMLLTPEENDAAAKKSIEYRAPRSEPSRGRSATAGICDV